MESKEYLEEVDLQKYWLVLKRRWLPATGAFGAIVILSVLASLLQKPTYQGTATLLIRTDRSSSLLGLDVEGDDLRTLTSSNSPLQTQAEVVTSIPIAQETISFLNLKDDDGEPLEVESFLERLKVKNITKTDVLQIFYESSDPKEAAAVVNKVMEIYIAKNVSANRAEASAARDFISQQLPGVENSVRRAEAALRQFKEQNQIIALDKEASASVDVISGLDSKIAESRAQLAAVTTKSNALREQLGMGSRQAVILASLSQDSGVQNALKEYQDVQTQLSVQQTRYQVGHPAIANLERRADALRSLIQQRVGQVVGGQSIPEGSLQIGDIKQRLTSDLVDAEVNRLSLLSEVNKLSSTQAAYRQRANALPRLAQVQGELERGLKASQSTYETLLKRLQEVEVAENQNVGNARIISQALIPKKPVAPRKLLYVAAGLLVGTLTGTLVALLLDLMDQSIKTLKEAKELFQYPLLGVIPAFTKNESLNYPRNLDEGIPIIVTRDMLGSPVCDAFQMLQANLRFVSSDKPLKTLVVTSSVAKEGKSTVSANLAAVMAQLGLRVLLIDADMRHPSQHHIWDLTNAAGLSNVLVGQAELRKTVQEVMPNLHVLPSGIIPPNPVALLDSNRMFSLIDTFSNTYDFVIFDTPSLAGTADAAILGKVTDGILLVAQPGVVDIPSATATKEFLSQFNQTVLGLVANNLTVKHEPSNYFYYLKDKSNSEPALQKAVISDSV